MLAELRKAGIAMGTRYKPTSYTDPETNEDHVAVRHIGYTTDADKAQAARDLGATVTACGVPNPSWEIMVTVFDP